MCTATSYFPFSQESNDLTEHGILSPASPLDSIYLIQNRSLIKSASFINSYNWSVTSFVILTCFRNICMVYFSGVHLSNFDLCPIVFIVSHILFIILYIHIFLLSYFPRKASNLYGLSRTVIDYNNDYKIISKTHVCEINVNIHTSIIDCHSIYIPRSNIDLGLQERRRWMFLRRSGWRRVFLGN